MTLSRDKSFKVWSLPSTWLREDLFNSIADEFETKHSYVSIPTSSFKSASRNTL